MPETYTCKKCGAELFLDDLEKWAELCCTECGEPIPQEILVAYVDDL